MLLCGKRLLGKSIILGSASPRRKQLLEQMGISFSVQVSGFEENLDQSNFTPEEYVRATSAAKAKSLQEANRETDLIICADTIVTVQKQEKWIILEKPKDFEHAKEMLEDLSGKSHEVITAVTFAVPKANYFETFTEKTKVYFHKLCEEDIITYIQTNEPFDKAGGYGIQGLAGCFVEKIEGCYFNVMGFPIHRVSLELSKLVDKIL